jgi:raffinose/stachyose/melibiose transport system substrate-binding protein
MKSRILQLLLSAAAFTGFACSVSPASAQDAAKPPVPSGNVTVSLWGIATQPWQIMIDDFQKTYPNIKIKWTKYSTDEIKQAVRVASAAGKMSDTWFNWGGSLASPYDEGGHALELTPELMAQYGVDKNILPPALDLARYNGKLYGIPVWVRPMTIFYKKSLLDKFGIPEPKTFDDLEQACAKLKANGIIPSPVAANSVG